MSTATLPTQTKTIKVPKELFRAATIEPGSIDAEKKTLRMSISSDREYLRYDYWNDEEYYEILDHGPGGVDDSRLKAGLPILFNHDRNQHLGRATSFTNDGHKITVEVKFSESPFAQEKLRDALAGVLPDTSVGYMIDDDEGECIDAKDGKPVYRFKWAPYEASIVTVPADISVGVGRQRDKKPDGDPKEIEIAPKKDVDEPRKNENNDSQQRESPQKREKAMETTETPTKAEAPKIDVVKERGDAIEQFKGRCKKIDDFVGALKNEKWRAAASEVAAKHKAGEANFDEFRTEALNSFEKAVAITTPGDKNQSLRDVPEKDKQRFSIMAAIRQLANKQPLSGLEKELSDEAAKAAGISPRVDALYVGPAINEYDLRNHPQFSERAFGEYLRSVNATTGTSGGFTVATQMGSMIEYLRNRTVLDRAGITTISGLHGDLAFPVQTGGATAYWVSEEECVTDSAPTFAQKTLTPHRLSASIPFTSQFLAQTSLNAEQFLRNELMTVAGLKLDNAGLEGTGTGGEPLGVKYTPNVGADITFGGAAVWGDMVDFETYIETANADLGSMAFIVSAATKGKWKQILRVTAGAAGDFLIKDNEANGYPVYSTNQVTGDIVFFGVWSQLIHAMWDTQEIIVDPYALKKCGGIEITYNSFHDFLVRQPKAFEVSTDTGAA